MEVFVEIQENVRGEDVFVIQSTSFPANDNLMELLVTLDALRRSSARRITAVIPYFGYARQDRKSAPRTPISRQAGGQPDHRGRRQPGPDDGPARRRKSRASSTSRWTTCIAAPLFSRDIQERYEGRDLMIVSPDVGGVVRARAIATRLNCDLAIIDKRRERAGHSEVMNVIGDVAGRDCILIDDLVDSGGTHCNAADALMKRGARSASAYVTHGVLSGAAVARIAASPIEMMTITDSIQATDEVKRCGNIRELTIAPLLAEAMRRISDESSVSSLFD